MCLRGEQPDANQSHQPTVSGTRRRRCFAAAAAAASNSIGSTDSWPSTPATSAGASSATGSGSRPTASVSSAFNSLKVVVVVSVRALHYDDPSSTPAGY